MNLNGPEHAAGRLADWLRTRLPVHLDRLADAYDQPLAKPVSVLAYDEGPLPIEAWPCVYVLPQRLADTRILDVVGDGSEVYRTTYGVRIVAWVRATSYRDTDVLRKRYALAVRAALLERKTAGTAALGTSLAIVPSSIREDYSDVMTDEANRTIAGTTTDVDVVVAETFAPYLEPIGRVDTYEATVAPLPIHPALE